MSHLILNDLSDCVASCSETVEIIRFVSVSTVNGRKQGEYKERKFKILASVTPATGEDLKRFPEGMLTEGSMLVISPTILFTAKTSECKSPDQMDYHGSRFAIVTVKDWFSQGGFYEMFAKRLDT